MRFLLILALLALAAAGDPPVARPRPVRHVGDQFLAVGATKIPLYASADWSDPPLDITRVVIVVHGLDRSASAYFTSAREARAAAGPAGQHVLLLAPQFLADEDIAANALPQDMLHWGWDDWMGGEPANGPTHASAFDAMDAILATLADHARFPALKNVVIAGHSAGGQVVQRYAVVGNGEAALAAAGVHLRYVVANPSSYLYFGPDRPIAPASDCAHTNQWRYGFAAGVPPYVTQDPASLERRYIARDVIYLLGTADTDPHHPQLDKSCAAEAEGPFRYARGLNYLRMLRARDGAVQRLREVPGVAHSGRAMFTSACGLASLFDTPGCTDR